MYFLSCFFFSNCSEPSTDFTSKQQSSFQPARFPCSGVTYNQSWVAETGEPQKKWGLKEKQDPSREQQQEGAVCPFAPTVCPPCPHP